MSAGSSIFDFPEDFLNDLLGDGSKLIYDLENPTDEIFIDENEEQYKKNRNSYFLTHEDQTRKIVDIPTKEIIEILTSPIRISRKSKLLMINELKARTDE